MERYTIMLYYINQGKGDTPEESKEESKEEIRLKLKSLLVEFLNVALLHRVDSVFSVDELDYGSAVAANAPVRVDDQILHRVDQPSLHVTASSCTDSRVDQSFTTTHRVEEIFRRAHSTLEITSNEAVSFSRNVVLLEVRQCS